MTPKDRIKEKISIYDTVSHYIRLEKSGNQWKARCPFHNEKTPSFYVSPQRGSYHCFGCDKGGDIFTFVMEIEKIEFLEALKVLAKRAGISLSEYKKEDNDDIYEILNESKNYFFNNLKNEKNIYPKKYLLDRGVSDESIDEYSIGFAGLEWTGLYDYLIKLGYKKENIVESGVCFISQNSGKILDKWRGRIMFPICGQSDQVLGFTGRILPEYDDGKQGKYVNSPETKVFKKNQILFNYNKAKNYIAESKEVILVEGQMDAIMSNQAGVKNVVAVSGTAFTDTHINILKRLSDNIVLCFDNDEAGKSARNRTALLCALAGFEIYNMNIEDINSSHNTDYKDVADIVKSQKSYLYDLINNKKLFIESLCQEANILEEKEKIIFVKNNILSFIKAYNSPLLQNHYLKIISKILNYDLDMLINEIKIVRSDVFVPDNKKINNLVITSRPYTSSDEILDLATLYSHFKSINNKKTSDKNIDNKDTDNQNTNNKDINNKNINNKIITDNIDENIEEYIKSKMGDFDFYNKSIFDQNIADVPEEIINQRFIILEKENRLLINNIYKSLSKIILQAVSEKEKEFLENKDAASLALLNKVKVGLR